MQMSYLVNDCGIIKKTFPPKTSMREKQLLQDPGYATCQHCRYMHAMR